MQKKITVYTGSYCPYCTKAKELLDKKALKYDLVDVTKNQDLREEMMQKSGGKKTIPQIFIEEQSIGGFDDLNALEKSGELDKILEA